MDGMLAGTALRATIGDTMLAALGVPQDRAQRDSLDPILDCLKALGIQRVVYSLEGSGDSGEATLSEVEYADGRTEEGLPDIPAGFTESGAVVGLEEVLTADAGGRPDINWYDNEGGSGEVVYLPMEAEGDRIECDVTEHTDDDEYDEDDEFEIDDENGEPERVEEGDLVIPGSEEEDDA